MNCIQVESPPDSVKFGKGYLNVENLYLLELQRCGSTIQPIIGILREQIPSSLAIVLDVFRNAPIEVAALEHDTEAGSVNPEHAAIMPTNHAYTIDTDVYSDITWYTYINEAFHDTSHGVMNTSAHYDAADSTKLETYTNGVGQIDFKYYTSDISFF